MSEVKTYDFKEVSCILGANQITGFEDSDDAVKVEPQSNLFNTTVGADGEATRSKTNNFSAKVTLKLLKTSSANDILNQFYQADRLSNSGVFPFLLKDNNGVELHTAEKMWIEKAPAANRGTNAGINEWVLMTHFMVSNYGGNV